MRANIQDVSCEVCGAGSLKRVLDLGLNPMCDDLLPIGSKSTATKHPISILHCRECNTAHQEFQIPKVHLFPKSYHYRSRMTADVLSGMEDLVESVEAKAGSLRGLTVLDIGCNDGSLLNIFRVKGCRTIGVEPTGAALDAMDKGHAIINSFFSDKVSSQILSQYGKVDIITFTNVFAHIEDLPELLAALRLLMSDDTTLVIENHYLGSILAGNQFDTFYHEHPRTYSLQSFINISNSLDKSIFHVQLPKRYGGNIRVFIGNRATSDQGFKQLINEILESEADFPDKFTKLSDFIENWRKEKSSEIRDLIHNHGRLVAKAFPGRAAIPITLLGLTENDIECVYEKPGSPKINHYVPGTRIPIKSDVELFDRVSDLKVILNLAWHIPSEISQYLTETGFDGKLVHII